MFINCLREVDNGTEISSDICIVGSGPAGLTLALELVSSGCQIVVLEAGGQAYSKDSQDFYRGEIARNEHSDALQRYRYRQLGGTSTAWGGRCLMYDPIDFERRDYVPESGWPIEFDSLIPHYERALKICEAAPMVYDAASALPGHTPEMIPTVSDGDIVTTAVERWSPPTNFGKRYKSTLHEAKHLRVFLNAPCVEINLNSDHESAVSVTVRVSPTKSFVCKSKAFVLAAGGVEVPRLLLTSNHQIPTGIGNHHDLVGRFYMTHLTGVISTAHLTVDPSNVGNGYDKDPDGIYVRRRIAISDAAQRRERLPNFTAQFHHPSVIDPAHRNSILSAMFVAKHIGTIRRGIPPGLGITETYGFEENLTLWLKHIRNLVIDAPTLMGFLPRFAYQRFLTRRRIPSVVMPTKQANFPVHYHAEQTPNRNSRITLSEERDKIGIPRVRLDFRINDFDLDGIIRAHQLLGNHLSAHGAGYIKFNSEDPTTEFRRPRTGTNGHFIGATRMSDNAKDGVVNEDCRVFGLRNLFIASSSVFPTSSHANPTLTIVAMSIRLADHLRDHLNQLDH